MSGISSARQRLARLMIFPVILAGPILGRFMPEAVRTLPTWHRSAERILLVIAIMLAATIVAAAVMTWRREQERWHG